jgi:membrane-associated phospholipid phosphatase
LRKCYTTAAAALVVTTLGAASGRSQSLELPPDLRERPTLETPSLDTQGFDLSSLDLRGDIGEDRRTLGAFPKNLGRNFVGVFSGQNLFPFAVGVGSATLASAFDGTTKSMLKGACDSCGRTGATMGGTAIVPVMATLFVAGRFAPQGRFRSATYDVAQAMIVNAAYTGALKRVVGRTRPDGSDTYSFPSGHTSNAFSIATIARHHYGWRVGAPMYALAAGIGLTRIEQDRHHLSDVIAGATIGLIVGRTVTRIDGERPDKKRFVSIGPATDPEGRGVGLGVSASW